MTIEKIRSKFREETRLDPANYKDGVMMSEYISWLERQLLRSSADNDDAKHKKGLIKAVYKFPNEMVAVFGYDNKQMPEFNGEHTKELEILIAGNCDGDTQWHGFNDTLWIKKKH